MSGNNNNNDVVITRGVVAVGCYQTVVGIAFSIVWAISLSRMTSEELSSEQGKWFIAYTTMYFGLVLRSIVELNDKIQNYGSTWTRERWAEIAKSQHFPFSLLQWGGIGCIITGWYFVPKFLPVVAGNCPGLEHAAVPICASMQMITVFTLINTVVVGLGLVIISCMCLCMCCVPNDNGSFTHNPMSSFAWNLVSDYIPFTRDPPSDGICAVCYDADSKEIEWVDLRCKHKFHGNCIRPWLEQHHTCPTCRGVDPRRIRPPTVNQHVITPIGMNSSVALSNTTPLQAIVIAH